MPRGQQRQPGVPWYGESGDRDAADRTGERELTWNLQHHDYVFEAGHRIGIVISGPETRLASGRHPTTNNQIEIKLGQSRVELPVVGGAAAIRAAFQ